MVVVLDVDVVDCFVTLASSLAVCRSFVAHTHGILYIKSFHYSHLGQDLTGMFALNNVKLDFFAKSRSYSCLLGLMGQFHFEAVACQGIDHCSNVLLYTTRWIANQEQKVVLLVVQQWQ